jgi:hypothetical protein
LPASNSLVISGPNATTATVSARPQPDAMNAPNLPMLSPDSAAAWPSMPRCMVKICIGGAPAANWSTEPRTTCISSICAIRVLPIAAPCLP